MAFWLARTRTGQDTDAIQRFDPRFWTVNFPRPMMASVVTPAPDALRVDCDFHHTGALAGLIWDSEDTLDHPLLRYETRADYAHCELSFRWRSQGLVPLDAANGPTLTIEGRDAAGMRRSWYVRLWNYATGSGEDALIRLPFSDLRAGWALGGDAVHPSDIDRMFISLAPAGYVPNGEGLLANGRAWAELTGIDCQGDAMLTIGDAMLPPHGERMATAYDDAFNQTPARLVRQIEQLGYREEVVHYAGMSHFFALVEDGAGRLVADPSGALCEPARVWHRAFFSALAEAGFSPIVSISYELFAAHCPDAWQQRGFDGTPGRTGWDPPSALLSPANPAAMGWLQAAAAAFARLAQDAGHPVRFQVGEPWWWLTGHEPCCYDAATLALYDGTAPRIDLSRGLTGEEQAFCDWAGALLAASTAALVDAVRDAVSGPVESLLLVFTPTVLEHPDAARLNMPVGWAFPAFDRLQVEDYDWLTAGADAPRRKAYALTNERLGYPVERQDYFSGFVLRGEDADLFWRRIDAGLDEAARRGVARRFVWALPQVARDGYTRLAPPKEDDVTPFDDVAYPLRLGRDMSVSPEFSTSVVLTASGHERRNALWADARMRYDVGPGVRSQDELAALLAFFRARHGPARGFRLRDPFDFSTNAMTGVPTPFDALLGSGDGMRADFPLCKCYGEQERRITRPERESVRVSVGGVETAAFDLDSRGIVVLHEAPAMGAQVRAGFLFDVPVRFAEDRIDVSGLAFTAGEAPSVPLVEIREAV